MDAQEVRDLFYAHMTKGEHPDEAATRTYESVGLRLVASIAPPQEDSPWYWRGVTAAIALKALLCRSEMRILPGSPDPTGISGRGAEAYMSALELECELLECFHDHLQHLPPTPLKAKHDRSSLAKELSWFRTEQSRCVAACINGGYTMVPHHRFSDLDRFAEGALEALLGVMTYSRFAVAFADAVKALRAEYALWSHSVSGSAN